MQLPLAVDALEERIVCAAGDLDVSFNGTGKAVIRVDPSAENPNDVAHAMATQPDGKILLAGTTFGGSETDFAVARLNVDGSLDASFGTNGVAIVAVAYRGQPLPSDDVRALCLQPDGKIVVAGSAGGAAGSSDFAVVRLAEDGTLDPTFGSGGINTFAFAGNSQAFAAAVQPAGGILVAGDAQTVAGAATSAFAAIRLTADGTLDSSFGNAGEQTVSFSSDNTSQDAAHAIAIDPDGSVILAGVHSTSIAAGDFALTRLTPQGRIDAGFGSGGLQSFAISAGQNPVDVANGVALQTNQDIVVVGSAEQHGFGVARLTPSGALDPSFNGNGILNVQFPDTQLSGSLRAAANAVAIASDGGIFIGGSVGTEADFGIVRLTSTGALDANFASTGKRIVAFDQGGSDADRDDDEAYALALDADGKLVVGGYAAVSTSSSASGFEFAAARLLTTTPMPPSTPPIISPPGSSPPTPIPPSNPFQRHERGMGHTPKPAGRPLPPGFRRTPPKIIGMRTGRMRGGNPFVVFQLDQRIVARLHPSRSIFSISGKDASNTGNLPIVSDVYRARPRSIKLVLGNDLPPHGTIRIDIDAARIVNLLGQTLDGNADGTGGDDFIVDLGY